MYLAYDFSSFAIIDNSLGASGLAGQHSATFLRSEPIARELISVGCRKSGYSVYLLDLQASSKQDYFRLTKESRPEAVGFSLNYFANIPEVIDLAEQTRQRLGELFIFVAGHGASFTTWEILEHGAGAIDWVVRGEGEEETPKLVTMAMDDHKHIHTLPGIVSLNGDGPPPELIRSLDALNPTRDLLPNERNISSACSIRPAPLNSPAVVPGIASSAAHGHSMAAVLPGLTDRPIRHLPDLTPAAWVAQHS